MQDDIEFAEKRLLFAKPEWYEKIHTIGHWATVVKICEACINGAEVCLQIGQAFS
jgi:hypothetical protein